MALSPDALIFLLGEDLDEAVRLQGSMISAGIRNPIFALRDFSASKTHLEQLASHKKGAGGPAQHLLLVSLEHEVEALDFIRWLRCQAAFDRHLVLALGDHAQSSALKLALNYGANDFHYKDGDHEKLTRLVQTLPLVPAVHPPSAKSVSSTVL